MSAFVLTVGPSVAALADDGLSMPETHAYFDYGTDVELNDVEGVAFLSDCCDASCGDDCCCGEACEDECCGCGDECGDGCCDACGDGCGCSTGKKAAKPNPCAGSHKGLFYANDFSYLNDPCYRGCCLGDSFKQLDAGCGKLDLGGQLRFRYHSENSQGHPGQLAFTGSDEDFLLSRLRLYGNYKANDWARLYVEGIFADATSNDDYVPRPIDRNFGDLLNAFVDVKLTESFTLRVGRQELLYGAQRLVSPLDWANTRRTFEGIRGLYKHGDWAIDGFYTNLVPVDADDFDEADYDQSFYGLYATYTGAKTATYDFYYLGRDDERPSGTPTAPVFSAGQDFSLHTIGSRLFGGQGSWLYELEGGYQFGSQNAGLDHRAGFFTAGLGKKIDTCWDPTLWFYFDYASGNDGDGGSFNRFNDLFPLAHKYLGFADFVARQNVVSPNMLVTMKPSDKWSLLFWYYHIGAAVNTDVVPGVASQVGAVNVTQDPQSDDFLHELDIIAKRTISPRSDLLFGYSTVWAGDRVVNVADRTAEFFYTQWTLNF